MEKIPKEFQVFSYRFGPYRLDLAERRLLREGQVVTLTPKVFDLLRLLVQHSGHLLTKEQLLEEIWPETFVEEANLSRAVSVLRKALGEGLSDEKYVETVSKHGYRFVAPVTEIDPAAVPSVASSSDRRTAHARQMAMIGGVLLGAAVLVYAVRGSVRPGRSPAPAHAPVHRQVTFSGKDGGSPALSSDGRRVAYVSHESPERTLMVLETAGGHPIGIFSAPEVARPRWSPDGSELMIWARGAGRDGINVIARMGGIPREIARGQFVACWSPDGSTIAVAHYLSARISFVSMRTGAERSVSLEGVHRWIWDIDWSPVDDRLVFASTDDEGRFSVWTMRPDGSDQRKVLQDRAEISSVRWAPRGHAIYYFRRANQTVSLNKIAVRPGADIADAVPASLLTGLEAEGSFAVSADGRSLVYARSSYYSNLWTVQRNGSGKLSQIVTRNLTRGTSLVERPRVSPDGKRIVFNIGRDSLANLYVMPMSGGAPKQVTFLEAFNVGAVWSPDGQSIAFASTTGGKPRVWIAAVDAGVARPLSSGDLSADNLELAWSPGAEILYQQAGNRNFYRLDPSTGSERLLIKDGSVGWAFSPVHAPVGKVIALAWNRRPTRGVWILDEDGAREKLLYEAAVPPVLIGWSADGTSIFALEGRLPMYRGLTASRGETLTNARIVRISVRDGAAAAVLALPFAEVGGVSMTPDGSVFVCTVYSSQSDVWLVDHFDADED